MINIITKNPWLAKTAKKYPFVLPWIFLGLVISIPISTTMRGIFFDAAIILLLLNPAKYPVFKKIVKTPLAWFSILMFLLALFGCFWGEASLHEKIILLDKYIKFLFFPLLIAGFTSLLFRQKALNIYLLVMLGIAIVSYLKWFGFFTSHDPDPGNVVYNHIVTGLMMSYAAYIAAWFFWKGEFKLFYGLLLVLFTFQIFFIGTGRMSYILYTVLMSVFIMQILPWKKSAMALLVLYTVIGAMAYQSPVIKEGIHKALSDIQSYRQHSFLDTSVGFRMQFQHFSKILWDRNPLFGNGTAGFMHAFSVEKPVPGWTEPLMEPHNQYWLLLVEYGVLGCFVFAFFIYSLLMEILQLKEMRILAVGFLMAFLVGCLTDSLFLYSMTDMLFFTLMALCLGENYAKKN